MEAHEHLRERRWTRPDAYGGFSPDGDFLILSQNRDSWLLDRHNYATAAATLGAADHDDSDFEGRPVAYTFRAGHWAVGWVDYLLVRADAPLDTLTAAGEIVCALADYPILDESGYSDAEFEGACDYWARISVRERVEILQRFDANIFAARRDEMPTDDNGAIYQYLTEGL